MSFPRVVVVLSGKRKGGKDYVATILDEAFEEKAFIRNAGPIKKMYTELKGYNYEESLTASSYKETFREDMVRWSEETRAKDPNIFLRKSIEENKAHEKPVWILTDARRVTDLDYFDGQEFKDCKVIRIRIVADEDVRKARGYVFTPGIDDKQTECGLDEYTKWDYVIENNTTSEELVTKLRPIIEICKQAQ
ncbi:Phosphomevalonate kinase [Halotydeus destructor]|nr:Phosphomevalonate kinase [Halotydeus destructor]